MRVSAICSANCPTKMSTKRMKLVHETSVESSASNVSNQDAINFKGVKNVCKVAGLLFGACFGPIGAAAGYLAGEKLGKTLDDAAGENNSQKDFDDNIPNRRSDTEDWHNGR